MRLLPDATWNSGKYNINNEVSLILVITDVTYSLFKCKDHEDVM